jgi:2'-5' RNA ligase
MAEIRTFIAVRLNERIHRRLELLQEELRGATPPRMVRWVEPANIHLTLKFLGDVPEARIVEISQAIQTVAAGATPFSFELAGLGCFPNTQRPNVVWVGVQEPAGRLARLQENVESALERLGFAREGRGFSPHLTLGRVRREGRPADIAAVGQAIEKRRDKVTSVGRQEIATITLFKSDLRPDGPIYTALAEMTLGAGPT